MNQYVHHVPGRLRVRVPEVKGNPRQASSLEKRIRAQQGVKDVQISPLTGSVLVHYNPETASVLTLSQMMFCSAATSRANAILPSPVQIDSNKRISQQIATRVAAAVMGHVMEMAIERAAIVFLAAVL